MEFYEVLRKRRMVRAFRPQPVPADSLERILAAAQRAPSAGFSQGQRYLVIQDKARRKEVAALCGEEGYVAAGFAPWISQAPALVIPCVSEAIYRSRYREPDKLAPDGSEMDWPVPYWYMDIGCGVMALLLAAVAEGLAAGFAGLFDLPAARARLGIPDEMDPMGVIPIGYPAPDQRSPSLKRGRARDVVRYERW